MTKFETKPILVGDWPGLKNSASTIEPCLDVGFTVINFNTAAQTLRCLKSLCNCQPPPAWIFVLDNASEENDFFELRSNLESNYRSRIKLFRSKENIGFAAGSNFLIDELLKISDCHYIGLLNNDAVALPELVRVLRLPLIAEADVTGMSGARMHKLKNPQEVDTLGISLYASLMSADRKDLSDTYLGPTGGCCLMTRRFIENIIHTCGYCFDSRFFCYWEDTDLALRANLLGYKPAYTDTLVALHEGQASSNKKSADFIAYHGLRNSILMHFKCLPRSIFLIYGPYLVLAHILTIIRYIFSGRLVLLFTIYRDAFILINKIKEDRFYAHYKNKFNSANIIVLLSQRFYRKGYLMQILKRSCKRF